MFHIDLPQKVMKRSRQKAQVRELDWAHWQGAQVACSQVWGFWQSRALGLSLPQGGWLLQLLGLRLALSRVAQQVALLAQ
ncbi:hypothetical protein IB238_23560 [Rhizobium sp. ARZ01]|nr:hypothetical protein [Rhizobium sp. ARZ01]